VYFKEFIDFFFREMAADLDWSRGYVFLDKELQQVAREAALGRRYVDKLPATCPPVPVFCKRVFGSRGGDLPAIAMCFGIAVAQRSWRWQAGGRRVASSGEAGGAGAALQAVCVWGRTSLTH